MHWHITSVQKMPSDNLVTMERYDTLEEATERQAILEPALDVYCPIEACRMVGCLQMPDVIMARTTRRG